MYCEIIFMIWIFQLRFWLALDYTSFSTCRSENSLLSFTSFADKKLVFSRILYFCCFLNFLRSIIYYSISAGMSKNVDAFLVDGLS